MKVYVWHAIEEAFGEQLFYCVSNAAVVIPVGRFAYSLYLTFSIEAVQPQPHSFGTVLDKHIRIWIKQ